MRHLLSGIVFLLFCSAALAAQGAAPTDLKQLVERADILLARRAYQEAVTQYLEAAKVSPTDSLLQNKVGVCYQRMGQLSSAEQAYAKARKLDPKNPNVWNNLGTVQFSRGNYKQAVKSYRKAVQLKPDLAVAHQNLGCAYLAIDKPDQAMEAYQHAVRLDPGILDRTASDAIFVQGAGTAPGLQSFYFAKIAAIQGQLDNAVGFLEKAVKQGFKDKDKVVKDPAFKDLVKDPRFMELSRTLS